MVEKFFPTHDVGLAAMIDGSDIAPLLTFVSLLLGVLLGGNSSSKRVCGILPYIRCRLRGHDRWVGYHAADGFCSLCFVDLWRG